MEPVEKPSTKKNKLYEEIAKQVSHLIDRGTFRPGDRIPSVRKLSYQQKISITTVLEAYRLYVDSLELYELALKSGITFAPGPLFSAKQKYRNFIRLKAASWSEKAEEALAKLGQLASHREE